ncbi:MAG: TlpA family protein disulfide reductase [Treponema sp.]|jgi:thiol-disulfide isomerase/thioredoxin|nr:TlpA family protein disulfide reductase [Treponema sp.]
MKKANIGFWVCLLLIPVIGNAQTTVSQDVANRFRQAGIAVQNPIPIRDFQVQMLDGSIKSLSGFKNQVVFLNFWATWCGPCRGEMGSMQTLYQRFNKNNKFAMLAIDLQEDLDSVASFMRQMSLNFPVGIDSGSISDAYGITAIPTTFLIKNGYIIASIVGSRDWDTVQVFSAFEALLND